MEEFQGLKIKKQTPPRISGVDLFVNSILAAPGFAAVMHRLSPHITADFFCLAFSSIALCDLKLTFAGELCHHARSQNTIWFFDFMKSVKGFLQFDK